MFRAAALALLLAGCASSGEPLHGAAGLSFAVPRFDGRAAAPGPVRSTDGPEPAVGGSLYLDLLPEGWYGAFRGDSMALPEDLEPASARVLTLQTWDLGAGPNLLDRDGFRVDLFAGGRASLLHAADREWDPDTSDDEAEVWVDPIAGLRAEARLAPSLVLRLRGDGDLWNSGPSRAWRASLAAVATVSRTVSITAGWEMGSIHFDRHGGPDRFLLDADFSGPFLGVELRF